MSQFTDFTDNNITWFCFICDKKLKAFQFDIKSDSSKSNDQIYQRFRSIVSRYLNINLQEASKTLGVIYPDLQWDDLECCESCFEIVKKVCEIYDEWKKLQLELNWNLNQIGEMMEKSSKCASNLIHNNQSHKSNFNRDFKLNLESMNRSEYPRLILEKLKLSDDHEQQLQKQTVFVKLENAEYEEGSLSDNNYDLDEMGRMDLEINNCTYINCVVKPELTVEVKPEIKKQDPGENQKRKKRFPITDNGERNLKKFSCSICNMRFRMPSDLERHSRIHTGEKPFQCRLCEQRFSRKDTRKKHEMAHKRGSIVKTKPIPKLSCKFCSKKCSTNLHRIRHEWIHTGLKPFQCSVCERRFNDLTSVRRHIALVHKNLENAEVVKQFNSYKEFE